MFQKDKLAEFLEEPLAKARLKEVPAPFSLASLIAWLETKDPAAEYNYSDPSNCLMCQYLRCSGVDVRSITLNYWTDSNGARAVFPRVLQDVSSGHNRSDRLWRVWTFGAALLRARSYQATIGSGS